MSIALRPDVLPGLSAPPIALEAALAAFPDGVALCDRSGRIMLANAALDRLVGYPAGCLPGAELSMLLPRTGIGEAAAAAAERREGVARRADGALVPVEVSLGSFTAEGESYLLATIRDIGRRLQTEKQLRDSATYDGLTGVLNRATLLQVGEVEILRSRRYGRHFSVIMIDIDHFKAINDTHGHPAGDTVLHAVAETCRSSLRTCDVIGRYGGEEFALLLPETGIEGAVRVAERVRRRVAELRLPGIDRAPTISAGVAALNAGIFELGALIAAADRALYRAKRAGRDRVDAA
jgi:diguanylate cyclase (GGDEF)-like protein/PAS domain S-box-containing protein